MDTTDTQKSASYIDFAFSFHNSYVILVIVPSTVIPYWLKNYSNKDILLLGWSNRYTISTKPGKWAVMYMCVKDIDFASDSTIFLLDFATVPTKWFFFHFIIILFK